MLARLDGIPGVAESRVDRAGKRFLLALEPGADEREVASRAARELGEGAVVLDREGESEALASRRRGDLWVTSSSAIELSREEARVLASRFAEEAAVEIGLSDAKARRLAEAVEKEIALAFARVHGRPDALSALAAQRGAITDRVLEAARAFLTDEELQDLRAFAAAHSGAAEEEAPKCEPPAPVSGPDPAPQSALHPRDDLPGLPNFAQVSPGLYRGAQPSAAGMRELERLGVKTVVNLRSFHSDRDELRGTNLRYAHIHCKAWHPEHEDVVRFLAIVRDPANHPVFVHCQHGADRTGMMVAAYRVVEQNWTPDRAAEELPRFGFHEIWTGIREYLAKLDRADLARRVREAPLEELETGR